MTAPIPHAEPAILAIAKLENYCLDADDPRGHHKVKLFRAALGRGRPQAHGLRDALLDGVKTAPATRLGADVWGDRWRVDVTITRQEGRAVKTAPLAA